MPHLKTFTIMKSKSYFWLHCFLVALLLVLGMVLGADASPSKYRGHSKIERQYRQRQADCKAEQHRIQKQGIKKYKKNNPWQKGRR